MALTNIANHLSSSLTVFKKHLVATFSVPIFVCLLLLIVYLAPSMNTIITESASVVQRIPTPTSSYLGQVVTPTDLNTLITSYLSTNHENIGVVVQHLESGETYRFNEQKEFEAASLYKLWVMAVVYKKIEAGQLTEETQLSVTLDSTNESTSSISVKDALIKMITVSDNATAIMLFENVGFAAIKDFLAAHQLNNSRMGNPAYTSAQDVALFFAKLYRGELGTPDHTKKMIELLQLQTLNSGLPKYLPTGVPFGHKTGSISEYFHDAGIVTTLKGSYVIVFLSKSAEPRFEQERAARISETVYHHFNTGRR